MPKRLPFLCALGAYKLLRRAFVSLLFSWQVVPRQNSAFSLSLAPLPAVRRSSLLASSSDPARSLSEPPLVLSTAAPLTRGAPGPSRCAGFWGCASIRVLVVAEEGEKKRKRKGRRRAIPASERREGGRKRQLQTESWCELAQSAKKEKSIAGGGIKV